MGLRLNNKVLSLLLSLAVADLTLCFADEAADPPMPDVLDLREQARVRDAWLGKRLDTVIPMLMRRENIDMWLVIAREYDEDPVIETMLRSTWLRARRRTILLFYDRGPDKPIEKLSVARYAPGTWFEPAWIPEEHGSDQWARLAELIRERAPERIGINRSSKFALADGLGSTQYEELVAAIGPEYARRLVPAENLAIGWLETRIDEEMAAYPTIVRMAHSILAEGLSEKVITPGVTTTADVAWWYRNRIRSLGLDTWFHPGVSLERSRRHRTIDDNAIRRRARDDHDPAGRSSARRLRHYLSRPEHRYATSRIRAPVRRDGRAAGAQGWDCGRQPCSGHPHVAL